MRCDERSERLPPTGSVLSCTREQGHGGPHEDTSGQYWYRDETRHVSYPERPLAERWAALDPGARSRLRRLALGFAGQGPLRLSRSDLETLDPSESELLEWYVAERLAETEFEFEWSWSGWSAPGPLWLYIGVFLLVVLTWNLPGLPSDVRLTLGFSILAVWLSLVYVIRRAWRRTEFQLWDRRGDWR